MPRLILIVDVPELKPDEYGLTRLDHALSASGSKLRYVSEADPDELSFSEQAMTIIPSLLEDDRQHTEEADLPSRHRIQTTSEDDYWVPEDHLEGTDQEETVSSISAWRRKCGVRVQSGPPAFDPDALSATPDDRTILEVASAGAPVSARLMEISYPEIPYGRFAQRIARLAKRGLLARAEGAYYCPYTHQNWLVVTPKNSGSGDFSTQRKYPPTIEEALGRLSPDTGAVDDATLSALCIRSLDEVRSAAHNWEAAGRIVSADTAHGRRLYASDASILAEDPRTPQPELPDLAARVLNTLPDEMTFFESLLNALNSDAAEKRIRAAIAVLEARGLVRFLDLGRNSVIAATGPGLGHPARSFESLRAEPMMSVLPNDEDFLPPAYVCGYDLISHLPEYEDVDPRTLFAGMWTPSVDAHRWLTRWGARLGLVEVCSEAPLATDLLLRIRAILEEDGRRIGRPFTDHSYRWVNAEAFGD